MLANATAAGAAGATEVPLWDDAAPGLKQAPGDGRGAIGSARASDRWIGYVSRPTLTFHAAARAHVSARGLRWRLSLCLLPPEGTELARWLNGSGISAAVLKYRVLEPEVERTPASVEPFFADAERAMRTMRRHAEKEGIDPGRIGPWDSRPGPRWW